MGRKTDAAPSMGDNQSCGGTRVRPATGLESMDVRFSLDLGLVGLG